MQLRLLRGGTLHSRKEITVNNLAEDTIEYSINLSLDAGEDLKFKLWQNSGDTLDLISDVKSTRMDTQLLHPR